MHSERKGSHRASSRTQSKRVSTHDSGLAKRQSQSEPTSPGDQSLTKIIIGESKQNEYKSANKGESGKCDRWRGGSIDVQRHCTYQTSSERLKNITNNIHNYTLSYSKRRLRNGTKEPIKLEDSADERMEGRGERHSDGLHHLPRLPTLLNNYNTMSLHNCICQLLSC